LDLSATQPTADLFALSLHDALPICLLALSDPRAALAQFAVIDVAAITQLVQQVSTLEQQLATAESQLSQARNEYSAITGNRGMRSEEHTSELPPLAYLVCRLLLEKK